jgi:hypothetical protein
MASLTSGALCFGSHRRLYASVRLASSPVSPSRSNTWGIHETILEECWKPAFARHLLPNITDLREELRYLRDYNTDRAHTGRWTRGRTPEQVTGKAKMWAR